MIEHVLLTLHPSRLYAREYSASDGVRTNIGLECRLETSLDEESVDNFMEVEKKGGEECGVVSTVISSINMWNRPRRLVGEEAVVDASTRGVA